MALSSTRQHFSLRYSFFQAQSDGSQFSWKWNFCKISKACFYSYNVHLRKVKFQYFGIFLGAHSTPKIGQNNYGCFLRKLKFLNSFKNTQNCFAYISATKYRSDVVLYSKRTAGYPLSPHIKTIVVAFLGAA